LLQAAVAAGQTEGQVVLVVKLGSYQIKLWESIELFP
jgi:hypothetical protein